MDYIADIRLNDPCAKAMGWHVSPESCPFPSGSGWVGSAKMA